MLKSQKILITSILVLSLILTGGYFSPEKALSEVNVSDEIFAASSVKAIAIPVESDGQKHPGYPIIEIGTSSSLDPIVLKRKFQTGGLILWGALYEHDGGDVYYEVGLFLPTGNQIIFDTLFEDLEPGRWILGIYMEEIPPVPPIHIEWGVRINNSYIHWNPSVHWFDVNM